MICLPALVRLVYITVILSSFQLDSQLALKSIGMSQIKTLNLSASRSPIKTQSLQSDSPESRDAQSCSAFSLADRL